MLTNDNRINNNDSVVDERPELTVPSTQPSATGNKCCAQAILVCRRNWHPFKERRVDLGVSAKLGKAMIRSKPSADNFTFNCKVLSTKHAVLWFENQKFYLKDTRSLYGTFVNNRRLSPANEESAPREVFSGDLVQFGVDVTENTHIINKRCIKATLKLFYPDGTEAKSPKPQPHCPQNPNQSNVCITSQQTYELSEYLNEAMHSQEILENKLIRLSQRVVTSAHESANSGWKSLVEEDGLLSRIETLQKKLEVYLNSQQNSGKADNNSKENTDSTEVSALQSVTEEVLKLIEDIEKYESAAKEAIQKAFEEKLIALTRLHEMEVAAKSHEEEYNLLEERQICETNIQELRRFADNYKERLKRMESSFILSQSSTASMIESSTSSSFINGQISSTNTESNASNECPIPKSETPTVETCAQQQEPTPTEQTYSKMSSEIDLLKELLAETRASKKSIDEELSRTVTELENLRSLTKQMSLESDESQQILDKTLKEVEEKSVLITSLKNQINDWTERVRNCRKETEAAECQLQEYNKLLHLKDDELSSLRVLLEEERKVQQKYANNYEQCRKQLCESQMAVKQSQTETELLRKKVYSCNEELRSSRSNLTVTTNASEDLQTKQELERLTTECQIFKSRLHSRESELISYRTQHQKLSADYECLQNSIQLLQKINSELELRGDNYWKEQFNTAKSDAHSHKTQLISISKELEELKQKFEDCSNDKEVFREELMFAKEDIQVFSYQSKIATACAVVPLFMLLIAVLMAYYPSVSTMTGTTDL